MVEAAKTFLQLVEGGRGARLLAVVAVLLSSVIAAEHEHHDDEPPVHAGDECILCSAGAYGDGDSDFLPTSEQLLDARATARTVLSILPSEAVRSFTDAQRVRGPPVHS